MIRVASLLWFLVVLSMSSGCSTLPRDAGGADADAELEAQSSEPQLPDVELTEDLLNDFLMADVAVQRTQYEHATALYRKLALQTRDPRLAERATRVALFSRDYVSALETGRLWLELSPDDPEGRQVVTALLIKTGNYSEAVQYMESLLAAEDDLEARYTLIIRLLGREQDRAAAFSIISRFVESYPQDASGLYAYSQLALRDGKLDKAEEAVDRLLVIRPDWNEAVILRTRVLFATNRDAQALEYMAEVVGRQPRDTTLRAAYGRMLVDAERLDEGYEQLEKVLKAEPENVDTLYAAGLVALRLEHLKDASKLFKRLSALERYNDEANFYLGRIAEADGDNEAAIRYFSKVGRGQNYIQAQVRKSLLMAQAGQVDSARALLHAVKARHPGQQLRLFLAEGQILRDVGMNEEARDLYSRALVDVPGDAELLYARAMVLEKLGEIAKMEDDLLAILERAPDHVDALNSLGYTLADRTDRFDEAYVYVKRALELEPDSFYILDSLGWVQFRLGMLDEAVSSLRKALALRFDPEIAAHLGEVLWSMGDEAGALDVWRRALKDSPDNEIVIDVMKRFGQ